MPLPERRANSYPALTRHEHRRQGLTIPVPERAAIYDFPMAVEAQKLTNHYTGEHARPTLATSTPAPKPPVRTSPERTKRPRMALVTNRQCTRTGCSEHAEVTLTYDYGTSHVWLDRLSPERDPHSYDMCDRHAARLSVPHGWRLEDRVSTTLFAETSVA